MDRIGSLWRSQERASASSAPDSAACFHFSGLRAGVAAESNSDRVRQLCKMAAAPCCILARSVCVCVFMFRFLRVIRDVATERSDFSVSVKLLGFDGIDLKSVFQDTVSSHNPYKPK